MPRLRLNLPTAPPNWTKTPNLLLDRLMPDLKDTELRIVLALVRRTYGWNRPGAEVAMTYRTLRAATGRGNEAVSQALDSLAARGLIHRRSPPPFRKPEAANPESGKQQRKER